MNEADILASTYDDTVTVYRAFKDVLENGETVFKKELEGKVEYENLPCALSSPSGGKLQQSKSTAKTPTDYILFVRPEVMIEANDYLVIHHQGQKTTGFAGRQMPYISHKQIRVLLEGDTA
jgi:hypothetical protein